MRKNNKWKFGLLSVTAILTMGGCTPGDTSTAEYTYNTYLSTSPSNWNVHNWTTSDESYVTGFTEMGFYDAVLNDAKNGYNFVTEMASDMPQAVKPEDVSDDEMEKYYDGIGNITENMVWDIPLNKDAVWEDGAKITAQDYVDSMERLLNPKYANYRADSYYNGNMIIRNAENYYKQGRQTIEEFYANIDDKDQGLVKDDSGYYYINLGKYTSYVGLVFSNADTSTSFYDVLNQVAKTYNVELQAERIINAYAYFLWKGRDHSGSSEKNSWERVKSPSDVSSTMIENDNYDLDITTFDKGFEDLSTGETIKIRTIKELNKGWITYDKNDATKVTYDNTEEYSLEDLKSDLTKVVRAITSRSTYSSKKWAWKLPLFTKVYGYDGVVNSDEIGIRKVDDYTIRFYLAKAISPLNLKFNLTSNFLVNVKLYDDLTTTTATGSKVTKYASNEVGNYKSYGPYKLTFFDTGKEIHIERNENWYGYKDGKHEGQFQMDEIITKIYPTHETALQEFEAGRLDDIDLTVSDVSKYGTSRRCTTTYESYTQKLSFNSERGMLKDRQAGTANTNKTIIANNDFRKGLSLSLNRSQFTSQATSGSKAFTGLLNDLYLANNSTGETYRSTVQGKSVYGKVYGHLGGETIDETTGAALSEDANGYNQSLAVAYVVKAIKEELQSSQEGHIEANNTIDIEFRVYDNSSENTKKAFDFINSTWTQLMADATTQLIKDGALKASEKIGFNLHMEPDQDYYTTAQTGRYDMIFSTWGGAAINPYGLMQVYCDSTFTQTCEYGFKGKQDKVELTIDLDENGDGIAESSDTRSFHQWYEDMNNSDEFNEGVYVDEIKKGDKGYEDWFKIHNKRLSVLAGLEAGVLNRFEAVPLCARGSSSLLSFKVENATDHYVSLIGYGGIRLMKFNYNNTQWSEFCSRYNNQLSDLYKAS